MNSLFLSCLCTITPLRKINQIVHFKRTVWKLIAWLLLRWIEGLRHAAMLLLGDVLVLQMAWVLQCKSMGFIYHKSNRKVIALLSSTSIDIQIAAVWVRQDSKSLKMCKLQNHRRTKHFKVAGRHCFLCVCLTVWLLSNNFTTELSTDPAVKTTEACHCKQSFFKGEHVICQIMVSRGGLVQFAV